MNQETAPAPQESPIVQEIKMLEKLARNRVGEEAFVERQVAFAKALREKYPDCMNRRAYHALVGSTIMEQFQDDAIEEDFPGNDSVINFLQSLAIP